MVFDPSVFEEMHKSKSIPSKAQPQLVEESRYDVAFRKLIHDESEKILAIEDKSACSLLPPQARLIKIEQELRSAFDLTDFPEHIKNAMAILRDEIENYEQGIEGSLCLLQLRNIIYILEKLDLDTINDQKLRDALKIRNDTQGFILKIAVDRFAKGLWPESLSLMSLLTALNSSEPDYWYRLGIVAQKNEQQDLALRAYELTSELSPDSPGPHIFSAEILIQMGNTAGAEQKLKLTKQMLINNPDERWSKHIADIENLLAVSHSDREE